MTSPRIVVFTALLAVLGCSRRTPEPESTLATAPPLGPSSGAAQGSRPAVAKLSITTSGKTTFHGALPVLEIVDLPEHGNWHDTARLTFDGAAAGLEIGASASIDLERLRRGEREFSFPLLRDGDAALSMSTSDGAEVARSEAGTLHVSLQPGAFKARTEHASAQLTFEAAAESFRVECKVPDPNAPLQPPDGVRLMADEKFASDFCKPFSPYAAAD